MRKIGQHIFIAFALILVISLVACDTEDPPKGNTLYDATLYENFGPLYGFPQMEIPADNPLTVQKVELGKMLFYEEKLSLDQNMSCATCHNQAFGFTDNGNALSINALGADTRRNSSQLFNLAFMSNGFFWDGRAATLEDAVLDAIINEQHVDWTVAVPQLAQDESYSILFQKSFEDGEINQENAIKAIASFLRIINSQDSKYDQWEKGLYTLSALEQYGLDSIFSTEKGDCFHCHDVPFASDNVFHNNGLQENVTTINDFIDGGLGEITGNTTDYGKMKTPTLRNLSYTAPYMHDGRFATIDEVLDFYSTGLHQSPNVDPLMKKINQNGIQLTAQEKEALKAFILIFDDPTFINNEEFENPF